MFEHSAYITASYTAAAVILAWCAFAPVIRTRYTRRKVARAMARRSQGDAS